MSTSRDNSFERALELEERRTAAGQNNHAIATGVGVGTGFVAQSLIVPGGLGARAGATLERETLNAAVAGVGNRLEAEALESIVVRQASEQASILAAEGVGGVNSIGAAGRSVGARGSGPASGFVEVSDAYGSSKAVQNFGSAKPTDFVFDPQSGRFIMGRGEFGHDSILNAGRISPTETTVGGRIWRQDGRLVTDEFSGHYGQNWTPEIRQHYQIFMERQGVSVTHKPWGQ